MIERKETAEETAAIEEYLVRSELQKTVARCIRDGQICSDDTLLDLWVTLPVTGRT